MAEQQLIAILGADVSQFQSAMRNVQGSMQNTANQLNSSLDGATSKTEGSTNSMMGSFKRLAGVMAGVFAVDKIKDFAVSMITASADAKAMSSQFSSVFGDFESEAQSKLDSIAKESGVMSNRMKESFTGIASFAKVSGMDTAESLNLSERAMIAVADSSAFYDKSLEETTQSLQSFLKGNYENDSALGISSTETTRNAKANELYGKSFNDLSESQKQLTLLTMVEEGNKLSGALGQASRESDGLSNVLGNLKQTWTDFQAKLGEAFLDTAISGLKGMAEWIKKIDVTALADGITSFGGYLKDVFVPVFSDISTVFEGLYGALEQAGVISDVKTLFEGFKEVLSWIKDNTEVVTGVLLGLGGAFVAFQVLTGINTAIGVFNALMVAMRTGTLLATLAQYGLNTAMLLNPFVWIAVGIGALIAIVVLLWKNWDSVAQWLADSWQWIQGVASAVWGGIVAYYSWCFDVIKTVAITVWNAIKSFLVGLWNGIVSIAKTVFNGIVNFLSTTWSNIVTTASTMWTNFKNKIVSIWQNLKQKISDFIQNIKDKITEMYTKAKEIVDKIKNKFKETNWSQLGKDVIKGIAKGITDNVSSVLKAIGGVASSALKKGKEFLKSGSPSKLFEDEVGRTIPQGIASGVKKEANVAIDAVEEMESELPRNKLRGILNRIPNISGTDNSRSLANTFNISSLVIREEADLLKLANELNRIMKRQENVMNRAGGKINYA